MEALPSNGRGREALPMSHLERKKKKRNAAGASVFVSENAVVNPNAAVPFTTRSTVASYANNGVAISNANPEPHPAVAYIGIAREVLYQQTADKAVGEGTRLVPKVAHLYHTVPVTITVPRDNTISGNGKQEGLYSLNIGASGISVPPPPEVDDQSSVHQSESEDAEPPDTPSLSDTSDTLGQVRTPPPYSTYPREISRQVAKKL